MRGCVLLYHSAAATFGSRVRDLEVMVCRPATTALSPGVLIAETQTARHAGSKAVVAGQRPAPRDPQPVSLWGNRKKLPAAADLATLHLCTASAGFQIGRGFLFGRLAHFDTVHHLRRACAPGKARSRTLMLKHISLPRQGGHAALHMHFELISGDLRSRQFGANRFFNVDVIRRRRSAGTFRYRGFLDCSRSRFDNRTSLTESCDCEQGQTGKQSIHLLIHCSIKESGAQKARNPEPCYTQSV